MGRLLLVLDIIPWKGRVLTRNGRLVVGQG
jgi:hypothetical protein